MTAEPLDAARLDALVADARAGSPAAFTALWRQLSPVVAGYVRGRGVGDPDDLTSEVFLAAYQRLSQFVGGGADFRRWLFTIAHHRAVDDLRQRMRASVEEPYDPATDPRRSASAESEALARLAADDALALLAGLPDDQRNVLLLRVVGELPAADVALVLGRSPDAVRQLQHRALARLRRDLAAGSADRAVTPRGAPTITET